MDGLQRMTSHCTLIKCTSTAQKPGSRLQHDFGESGIDWCLRWPHMCITLGGCILTSTLILPPNVSLSKTNGVIRLFPKKPRVRSQVEEGGGWRPPPSRNQGGGLSQKGGEDTTPLLLRAPLTPSHIRWVVWDYEIWVLWEIREKARLQLNEVDVSLGWSSLPNSSACS